MPGFTQNKFFQRTVLALAMAAVLAAGARAGLESRDKPLSLPQGAEAPTPNQSAQATPPMAARGLPDFTGIVATQGPAVVNISVTGKTRPPGHPGVPQLDPDDPFFEFFRRFQGPQREQPQRGTGSGFIVSADGVILTNAHVVAEADEITVKLTDKREFKAKLLGLDKATDVAVLRIEAKGLPTVRIGNPQTTRVGEWVLAIGAPFGFENTATAGIISAKSRSLPDEGYVPFLQTDAAVNPGNSGGPLFNLDGEVIGINSQIYSRSGGYMGLSFAIPIDVAMRVEKQIREHGKVSRGRIGVTIQALDQSLAESFGLESAKGALVAAVEAGSPADKAGIQTGDVILRFNGKDILASSDLPPLVAEVQPGAPGRLEIWRNGKRLELSVTVGEFQEAHAGAKAQPAVPARLGVAVRPLSPQERQQAEVNGGLLVEQSEGAAARAGIRPGDILLAVGNQAIVSLEQFRGLLAKADKRIALLVLRDGRKLYVSVTLGQ